MNFNFTFFCFVDQRAKIESLEPILLEKNIKLTTFWKGYAMKVCFDLNDKLI